MVQELIYLAFVQSLVPCLIDPSLPAEAIFRLWRSEISHSNLRTSLAKKVVWPRDPCPKSRDWDRLRVMMVVGLGGGVKGRKYEQKWCCVSFVNVGCDLFKKEDNVDS